VGRRAIVAARTHRRDPGAFPYLTVSLTKLMRKVGADVVAVVTEDDSHDLAV